MLVSEGTLEIEGLFIASKVLESQINFRIANKIQNY